MDERPSVVGGLAEVEIELVQLPSTPLGVVLSTGRSDDSFEELQSIFEEEPPMFAIEARPYCHGGHTPVPLPSLESSEDSQELSGMRGVLSVEDEEAKTGRVAVEESENQPLFKLLKKFDIDRMSTLVDTKNYDLIHSVSEASERLNDLLQRERNLAEMSPDEMSFLEAHQSLVDAAGEDAERVALRLGTDLGTGLGEEEAAERAKTQGLNRLSGLRRSPRLGFFFKHLFRGPAVFWLFAAALCFLLAAFEGHGNGSGFGSPFAMELSLGTILISLTLITGLVSHLMQPSAPRLRPSLTEVYARHAKVLRAGKWRRVAAEELVSGDVVEMRIGDRVPADVRIVSAHGMQVIPALTGETRRRAVSGAARGEAGEGPAESRKMVFYGSHCCEGSGSGVVVATGDRTLLGSVSAALPVAKERPTFLQRDTSPLLMGLFVVALVLVVFVMVAAFAALSASVFTALSLAVLVVLAVAPSGLMLSGYLIQIASAVRVRGTGLRVRQSNSLDTLGRMSVLCCDKSGLLTRYPDSIREFWVDGHFISADSCSTSNFSSISSSFPQLFRALHLSLGEPLPSSSLQVDSQSQSIDSFDRAVLSYLSSHEVDLKALSRSYTRIYTVPFEPSRMVMLTISRCNSQEEGFHSIILVCKGALEAVLPLCSTWLCRGDQQGLSEDRRREIVAASRTIAERGDQTLAFCQLQLNPFDYPDDFDFDYAAQNFPLEGYCFLGVVSFPTELKETSIELVNRYRNAGIQLVMITGDDQVAATAVARRLNLILSTNRTAQEIAMDESVEVSHVDPRRAKALVMHGEELRRLSDQELELLLETHEDIVFARTSKSQKRRIIQAFQSLGKVVGVTGSCASESPALRLADVGIARDGAQGSVVAQKAAAFYMPRDDFGELLWGIAECRRFGESLKSQFAFSLSSKAAQLATTLIFVLMAFPSPFPGILLLVFDAVFTVLFAVAYGFEPVDNAAMLRPPAARPRQASIINLRVLCSSYLQIGALQTLACVFTYIVAMGDMGISPSLLRELMPHFFDPDYLLVVDSTVYDYPSRVFFAGQLHSALLVTLLLLQMANLFSMRSQQRSVFGIASLRNPSLLVLSAVNLLLVTAVCYAPFLNSFFWTSPIPGRFWAIPLPFVFLMVTFQELAKYYIRRYPHGRFAQHVLF